ncbi:unnamed protein product [Musa banksii]
MQRVPHIKAGGDNSSPPFLRLRGSHHRHRCIWVLRGNPNPRIVVDGYCCVLRHRLVHLFICLGSEVSPFLVFSPVLVTFRNGISRILFCLLRGICRIDWCCE